MNTRKKRLLIAVTSIIIWTVCVYFGYVSYDVNDDAGMNLIAAGAYGPDSQYLVHINILHGYVLKLLYWIFPFINCYLWSFLVCNLLAVTGISMVLTDRLGTYASVVLTVGINLLFASDYYVHIQFTKNAALYISVGLVMLIWQIKKDVREKSMVALSFFMIILGLDIRWESFLLALPVVIGALIVDELYGLIFKKNKPELKKYSIALIPLVACLIIGAASHFAYYSDPGWEEFRKTEEVLSPMRDFNRYKYSDSPEEYQKAGFTETDFQMIKGFWIWGDTDYFTSERLYELSAIGEKYSGGYLKLSMSLIKETVSEVIYAVTSKQIAMAFAVVFLIAFLIADVSVILQLLYMMAVSTAEIYYFFCLERILWRAEMGIWLTMLLMGGYLISTFADRIAFKGDAGKEIPQRRYVLSYICMAVCIAVLILVKSLVMDNSRFTNGDNRGQEMAQLTDLGVHFVCYNKAEFGLLQGAQNIFEIDRRYSGYFKNMSDLGGFALAPVDRYYGLEKGITNPVKALFERDDVYYLGSDAPLGCIAQFISEKYGGNVTWEAVQFGETTAWKFIRIK